MGNCYGTPHKSTAEIAPSELAKPKNPKPPPPPPPAKSTKPPPLVKLTGPPNSFATSHIRLALLYKPVTVNFTPNEEHETLTLTHQNDVVSGSVDEILTYLDSTFPDPPLVETSAADRSGIWGWCGDTTPLVVWVVKLQHRSVIWHLERLVKWAEDMAGRGGGKSRGDPSMGTPRMEVKKFGRSYSQLLQVMLEHAQMEETVLFQILESADRGLCKAANEQHGRDLPLMNGIKEEIKTIGVMNVGSPDYQEILLSLISRLKKLKNNSKQHFEEEEQELLPLMEATELSKSQQEKVLKQSLDVMRDTHSHMFRFFMEGLRPQDAMMYFDLIKKYCENVRVSLMLHMMVD